MFSPHSLAAKLDLSALSATQLAVADQLLALGQEHLFADWEPAGTHEVEKARFLDRWLELAVVYPGGVMGYVQKARALLASRGEPAHAGCVLEQPATFDLTTFDSRYRDMERAGLAAAGDVAFVLVAGGLGERLGYDGVKMEIPFELTAGTSYLRLYCEFIAALERRLPRGRDSAQARIPFVIMTSDSTRDRTKAHLGKNGYFGLSEAQVFIHEQALVPCLLDARASLAKAGPYESLFKPSGHGDVHRLLHQTGLARRLQEQGKSRLVFIQDTNAQIVNLILPALGMSARERLDFNFVCVPRVPGEPIGAVIRLARGGAAGTVNVEYNELESLLARNGLAERAGTGTYSPFPGNINLLVVALAPYARAMEETGGAIAEFINPKYAPDGKSFAHPGRLETLMQDIARSLPPSARVGATLFERDWALAALKNSLPAAMAKARAGQPPYAAATAEFGFYQAGRKKLRLAGAELGAEATAEWHGIAVPDGARVVLSPAFALTLDDVGDRIRGLRLGRRASLVLDGDVILEDVEVVDGATLVVSAAACARVHVRGLQVSQPGGRFEAFSEEEGTRAGLSGHLRMRGYRRMGDAPFVIKALTPGDHLVGGDGVCRRVAEAGSLDAQGKPREG